MKQGIFKAYDIRGLYPTEIDRPVAYAVGFALARLLDRHGPGTVVVGRDARIGSAELADGAIAGLQDGGRNVLDIGMVTTPMMYFAVNRWDASGGIMVTASHNPREYNGFKLVRQHAIPLAMGSGLETVQSVASVPFTPVLHPGQVERRCVEDDYVRFLAKQIGGPTRRNLVIDAGNGATGPILNRVLRDLRIPHSAMYFEPDGRFPNHEANPLEEGNLTALRDAVRGLSGGIGVAFDGDGDRVAFLDESGVRVRGDLLTALLAESLLSEEGPADILYDLRSSRVVPEVITARGGVPVRVRVGHSFIKQALRDRGALFGGELSYHYYYRDFFYCESGILTMLKVLRILETREQTLEEAILGYRRYAHSGERNHCVPDVRRTIERVAAAFRDARQDRLDGLTVEYPDWWFNLRPSNTEPLLRLNLEAANDVQMRERTRQVESLITSSR